MTRSWERSWEREIDCGERRGRGDIRVDLLVIGGRRWIFSRRPGTPENGSDFILDVALRIFISVVY